MKFSLRLGGWLTISLIVLTGCNLTFGGAFPNTPLGNYDFFFYELSQSYAYKNYTFESGHTLDQIKAVERGTIDSSWESLQEALDRVIDVHIQDPHLYFIKSSLYSDIYESPLSTKRGAEYDIYLPETNSDIEWISSSSPYIRYGLIGNNDNIGYIYIIDLVDDIGGSDRLGDKSVLGALTDEILTEFHERHVDRIIVDIRSTAGGAVYRGKEIASRFVLSDNIYMISENMTGPNSYTVVEERIAPAGVDYYRDKPLIILVNTNTCSGGEMTTLMFQNAGGYIATLGAPTHGCTGTIIDKELLNGWIIRITTSRTFTPDRTDYFKVGLRPTEVVIQSGDTDNVLAEAVTQISNDS